jgi:hypothetical protein
VAFRSHPALDGLTIRSICQRPLIVFVGARQPHGEASSFPDLAVHFDHAVMRLDDRLTDAQS